ncbi:MAG: DUF4743 domain-containing protein [Alphaproteobacteria bacterium]|nr:DUF4743 domain-containing protein [Alphaproteobacteria bacterium]
MPGFLRHISACNKHDLKPYRPFIVAGAQVGWMRETLADMLASSGQNFTASGNGIALSEKLDNFKERTAALAEAAALIAARQTPPPQMRGEYYPVTTAYEAEPLAVLDRAAVPWFGTHSWGVHVNGFVRKHGALHIWLGERAADRFVAPGKFDNIIGGGQPFGLTTEENLRKEAAEEAGMSPEMAGKAIAAGDISYLYEQAEGLRQDTLFIYDLELPESFVPQNRDGEVAAFHLLPAPEVMAIVRDTDKFKFNVNLVQIDFLMRHGIIARDEPEYEALAIGLNRQPPKPAMARTSAAE